jgi:flagellin-like protein
MRTVIGRATPEGGKEDKNMKNENRNEEAVSPVIATILMVAITVVLAGVLYVWASSLAEGNTDGNLSLYALSGKDAKVPQARTD